MAICNHWAVGDHHVNIEAIKELAQGHGIHISPAERELIFPLALRAPPRPESESEPVVEANIVKRVQPHPPHKEND